MVVLRLILLFFCLAGTSSSLYAQEEPEWRVELNQIDAEIKDLTNEKNRYMAESRRYEDQGMRWQRDQKQEAKRAFQMADTKKQAAQMLQTRIDALNARKTQILQEHPEAK